MDGAVLSRRDGFVGENGCLGAVGQFEFGEHPRDVGLDGRRAHEQFLGGFGIRLTPSDEGENVPLPV